MDLPKRMHVLRTTASLWAAVACGLLVGCAGGGSSSAERSPREVEPGRSTEHPLGPIAPPNGFAEFTGEDFTVFAPAGFNVERRTSRNGEPLLVLTGPQADGTVVGIGRDVEPGADAIEQSMVLEKKTRLLDQASDVSRDTVEWPGAERAVLLQWTAPDQPEGAATPVPFRTVQLFAQVRKGLIINVVATAPVTSFEQAQVATVLRTFRPRAAS